MVSGNEIFRDGLTFGQRVSDKTAAFGGSSSFICIFIAFIAGWITINVYWLSSESGFVPFPFILLNLGLSSLATFQQPIIMMPQNRQSFKDRLKQEITFEINLKLTLMRLHGKMDSLIQNKGNSGEI
ncbi:MAG: putative membrane protein [Porticoccus sp.]|jgi:uncharacterized membrane protein